jgi:hypothetical protein
MIQTSVVLKLSKKLPKARGIYKFCLVFFVEARKLLRAVCRAGASPPPAWRPSRPPRGAQPGHDAALPFSPLPGRSLSSRACSQGPELPRHGRHLRPSSRAAPCSSEVLRRFPLPSAVSLSKKLEPLARNRRRRHGFLTGNRPPPPLNSSSPAILRPGQPPRRVPGELPIRLPPFLLLVLPVRGIEPRSPE